MTAWNRAAVLLSREPDKLARRTEIEHASS